MCISNTFPGDTAHPGVPFWRTTELVTVRVDTVSVALFKCYYTAPFCIN